MRHVFSSVPVAAMLGVSLPMVCSALAAAADPSSHVQTEHLELRRIGGLLHVCHRLVQRVLLPFTLPVCLQTSFALSCNFATEWVAPFGCCW